MRRGGEFQEHLGNPLAGDALDGELQIFNFHDIPGARQRAELVEDQAADGVDPLGLQFDADALAQVVEPHVARDQEPALARVLDVELFVGGGDRVGDDLLHHVGRGDDSLGAAELVHHDGEPLGVGQKAAQQVERLHRFRDVAGRGEDLGVGNPRGEQKAFDIQQPHDVVGGVGVDGNPPEALGAERFERLVVGEIVGNGEDVQARRHAIAGGFVAQFEDLLDDLAFGQLERPLLHAPFDERFELRLVQRLPGGEFPGRQRVRGAVAGALQQAADGIERREQPVERARAERRHPQREVQREGLGEQIAQPHDDGVDHQRAGPERQARGKRFPQHKEAEEDQRKIDQRVGEQQRAQEAAGIGQQAFERRRLEPVVEMADLHRLQREERRLQRGEES